MYIFGILMNLEFISYPKIYNEKTKQNREAGWPSCRRQGWWTAKAGEQGRVGRTEKVQEGV